MESHPQFGVSLLKSRNPCFFLSFLSFFLLDFYLHLSSISHNFSWIFVNLVRGHTRAAVSILNGLRTPFRPSKWLTLFMMSNSQLWQYYTKQFAWSTLQTLNVERRTSSSLNSLFAVLSRSVSPTRSMVFGDYCRSFRCVSYRLFPESAFLLPLPAGKPLQGTVWFR